MCNNNHYAKGYYDYFPTSSGNPIILESFSLFLLQSCKRGKRISLGNSSSFGNSTVVVYTTNFYPFLWPVMWRKKLLKINALRRINSCMLSILIIIWKNVRCKLGTHIRSSLFASFSII